MEKLIEKGRFNPAARIFANKKFVFEIDFLDLGYDDTEFPSPLMISQAETEAVLEAALPKKVDRGVIEKLEQDYGKVTAVLRHGDGSVEEVTAKYAVGCDGSHSFVRKSIGMDFLGGQYEQDFVLADVHMKWPEKNVLTLFMGR